VVAIVAVDHNHNQYLHYSLDLVGNLLVLDEEVARCRRAPRVQLGAGSFGVVIAAADVLALICMRIVLVLVLVLVEGEETDVGCWWRRWSEVRSGVLESIHSCLAMFRCSKS
jgi:hypothetical protein